jgi:hypothetical protein
LSYKTKLSQWVRGGYWLDLELVLLADCWVVK